MHGKYSAIWASTPPPDYITVCVVHCACVCSCGYMHVCMPVHIHMCMWVPEVNTVLSFIPFHLVFETESLSLNLGLPDLAGLSGSLSKLSGILQLQMRPLLHPAFTSVLGIQLRSSCLLSHTLMTAISSASR